MPSVTAQPAGRFRAYAALDPLSPREIAEAAAAVRRAAEFAALSERVRFITITLREPAKDIVVRWREQPDTVPGPREAEIVLLDQADGITHEVVVSLADGKLVSWTRLQDVQPLAVVAELADAEELVRLDPQFQEGLRRRGISDFDTIQVDAWPAGNFGYDDEAGMRLARCVAFVRPRPRDNEWAHPIDGLIALVDLNRLEVLRVDDHGVVPIPSEPGNFDPQSVGRVRDRRRAARDLATRRPELHGRRIRRVLAGLAAARRLHAARGSRARPGRLSRLRAASLDPLPRVTVGDGRALRGSEPDALLQDAFDAGEYGLGVATSSLRLGCDCLGEIHYFDASVRRRRQSGPDPQCHLHARGGLRRPVAAHRVAHRRGEVRRSRRLVISSFATIGNYDYGFFWYLYQDGAIGYEVKLTGVLSTGRSPRTTTPRMASWSRRGSTR